MASISDDFFFDYGKREAKSRVKNRKEIERLAKRIEQEHIYYEDERQGVPVAMALVLLFAVFVTLSIFIFGTIALTSFFLGLL